MLKMPDFLPPTLLATGQRLDVAAGAHLFVKGAPVEHLHWICRGELLAVRQTRPGQEAVIMRGAAGEFFAEASFFTPNYTCHAIARKPAVVLGFPLPALRQALATDAGFYERFLRSTVMALRRQCSRVERLRLRSATERIEHYLSCEAGADGWCQLEVPMSQWAIDLGLEPETLYRALAGLISAQQVARVGRRIKLMSSI
jgi:CRP-like cAMP-binding protein